MAKFFYRMQNILNIKNRLEEQAKIEFALANRSLMEEEEKLARLQQRKAVYEEEIKRLLDDKLQLKKIRENEAAVEVMKELIEAQILQVRAAERKVEIARKKLQNAMQERKTHDRLKEKQFEEFMQEENAKESKEIDELTSYRYTTSQKDE
ncbi:MAG TPA: flagellar export protein FliJ [Lachnospiraceae bacterium]|nr:flagellar export protein FliJ [Lachnospiraceae bacterium]